MPAQTAASFQKLSGGRLSAYPNLEGAVRVGEQLLPLVRGRASAPRLLAAS